MDDTLESPASNLQWIDFVVIGIYFTFVLAVGLYSSYRSKRASVKGYFLASRSMHWLPVGASLFASNIGSGHFIGLAGSGAASGIGIASFELSAVFVLMVLGWIFVPVYMASGVYTMPEYLRLRFGGQRIRVYLAVLALVLYVFTKISADLYAGALFIQLALGFGGDSGLYTSILILLAIAALFTIAGGLTAVMWTDFVQTILMIIGAFILMFLSFNEVGGYEELIRKYLKESDPSPNATLYDVHTNKSCGTVPDDAMHLFRDVTPGKSDLPWTGVIFGLTVSSIWYWCSDQVIVQRTLASKNMVNAKGGCILAGYLKLLPLYLLVFPGMAARVLYPDRVGCAHPEVCTKVCGSSSGCSNIAYAELVIKLMPAGLSGMMLAVMMAALMSSLTSIFNSSSTIFTIDIWTRIRNKPSETELLIVGRSSVLVILAISILWVPVLNSMKTSQLFVYIQSVSSFLAPSVTAVFIMALFVPRTNEPEFIFAQRLFVLFLVMVSIIWVPIIIAYRESQLFKYIQSITSFMAPPVSAIYFAALFLPRVNEQGAFWGLMLGLILGLFRFALEFSFTVPSCGSYELDTRPHWIKVFVSDIHYLHYGCILFIITLKITYVISLLTKPIEEEKLYRLTFWSRHSTKVRKPIDDEDDDDTNQTKELSDEKNRMSIKEELTGAEPSQFRKMINCICGVNEKEMDEARQEEGPKLSLEEEAASAAKFLDESKFWRRFVNSNAVLLMTVAVFFWAFYA